MVDRDPFRFPPPNNPFMLQYLTNLQQQSTLAQPAIPTLPAEAGQARTPTAQSASYAYNSHRALEQQLMARLQNMLPQDSAPLGDEPGLQFDDAHMTLDPNQLAQQ